nr:GNAT family N-acetyltransferase [Acidimangrovimonas sediminis]
MVFASFDGEVAVGLAGLLTSVPGAPGEIMMVYLRRSHRGSGRAAALIAACEARAREAGLTALRLRVAWDNARALGAYCRAGFAVRAEEEGGGTLVLEKALD